MFKFFAAAAALAAASPAFAADTAIPTSDVIAHQASFDLAKPKQPAISTSGAAAATAASTTVASRLSADEIKYRAEVRSAYRWHMTYQALNAIDAIQTCEALSRGFEEGNPLFGKRPKCSKLVAVKAGVGLIQYLLFRSQVERNPKSARLIAQIGTGIQGAVVGWNLQFALKSAK